MTLYHILLLVVSAVFALFLPVTISFIAEKFLNFWSLVGNDKIFFISIEMILTILFLFLTTTLHKNWKNRKLSRMAKAAGLVSVISPKGFLTKRKMERLKQKQGHPRDVMVICSTGFRTFVDPRGELHELIKDCQKARIMLLNPNGEGTTIRAKSIPDPEITPESLGEQIKKSIDFLKNLKGTQKNIKLKLYPDPPFLKMAILGNYIWLQHYQMGGKGQMMPKYVFKHDPYTGSLYLPFYHFFMERWNNPEIPEYDLKTDQLIYRDGNRNEVRKDNFEAVNNPKIVQGYTLSQKIPFGNKKESGLSSHAYISIDRTPDGDSQVASQQNLRTGLHSGGKQFALLRSKNPISEAADWIAIK